MPRYRMGADVIPHAPPSSAKSKIPYIKQQRAREGMTPAEKEGVRLWNLMVNTLQENGFMEDKK